jgi:tRNA (uracil-5-)-methyltransferase TRM9
MESNAKDFEAKSVHQVYEEIAEHFSSTRYKPWPVVEEFIFSQEKHAVGGDIGSGNGKYLRIAKERYMIGLDRSKNLVEISVRNGNEGIVADGLSLPIK